jgi:hypothetical protein
MIDMDQQVEGHNGPVILCGKAFRVHFPVLLGRSDGRSSGTPPIVTTATKPDFAGPG